MRCAQVLQLSGPTPLSRESLTVDSLLAMDPPPGDFGAGGGGGGGGGGAARPVASVKIVDGEVRVLNSYDIKDHLRTLGTSLFSALLL